MLAPSCPFTDLLFIGPPLVEDADAPASAATPYTLEVGIAFEGRIDWQGDRDWVRVSLEAGIEYRITLEGTGTTALSDPFLRLFAADGTLLALNDDSPEGGFGSLILFTPQSSGVFYMEAAAYADFFTGDYILTIIEVGNFPLSVGGPQAIGAYLATGYWQDQGSGPRTFDIAQGSAISVDLAGLGFAARALAELALAGWSAVSGLVFQSGGGAEAQIRFQQTGAGAWTQITSMGGTILQSIVNVSQDWLTAYGSTPGSYGFQTFLHEIGHALGLGHPGPYNGGATWGTTSAVASNIFLDDSWQMSVLSYFSQTENLWLDADFAYVATPMAADIEALSQLYGPLPAGDVVFGAGGTTGTVLDTLASLGPVAFTLAAGAGSHRLDLGFTTSDLVVDLRPGAVSDVLGLRGNMVIAPGTVIAEFVAGSGNDVITGNAADNRITAGGGTDIIDGGGGTNTVVLDGDRLDWTITRGAMTQIARQGDSVTLSAVAFAEFDDLVVDLGNAPPAVVITNQSVRTNAWARLRDIAAITDAEGDAAVAWLVEDMTGAGNFWLQGTGFLPAGAPVLVSAAGWQGLWLQGDALPSSQTLRLRAFDGNDWGDWASFVLTTIPNSPPSVSVTNITLNPGTDMRFADAVTYADPDGDAAVTFQVWDSVGGPNFVQPGTGALNAAAGATLTAAAFDSLRLAADPFASTQTLWLRANDGRDWGAWVSFTLVTGAPNARPEARIDNLALAAGSSVAVATILDYADPEDDPATRFQVWDSVGGPNWRLAGEGPLAAASGAIVPADRLADLWLDADPAASAQTLWIRADDGGGWGPWDSFVLTTV